MNKIIKPSAFSRRRFLTAAGLLVPASAAFPGVIVPSSRRLHLRSTPSNGVVGPLEEGEQVTFSALSGENFGIGPTYALFDPLNSGSSGATIATSNPLVGAYDSVGGAFFTDVVTPRHGNVALCSYTSDSPGQRQLRASWAAAQTVAVRYWWYIPVGSSIPDADSDGAYSSDQSSYKLFWLGINGSMNGGTDVCLPSFHGGTACAITGNGNTTSEGSGCAWDYPNSTVQNHFRYGQWVMVECLQDAVTSTVRMNHCSALLGMARYSSAGRANYWGDSLTQHWSNGNLPGYIRGRTDWINPSQACHIYHQDYSIKTGEGAWADVFIGNAATIDACTDLRHLQIESWSSDAIVGRPRGISGLNLTGWHAFIRKADNTFLPSRPL